MKKKPAENKRAKAGAEPIETTSPGVTAPGVKRPRKPAQKKTVVQKIREKVEKKLSKGVEKASLADYIRLVQLEREMADAEPKETKATWVDPKEREKEKETEKPESGK